MEMGFREYARYRGVSLGAVQKAIKANRIFLTENGKIDSDAADQNWRENTDESRVAFSALETPAPKVQQQMQLTTPPDDKAAADGPDDGELTGVDKSASEYRRSRATREHFNALRQQLEYEQLVGTLINVDDAKRIAYTSFRALRDSVMNVAARIKDQLAAESDPHACEALVENELSAALAGIDIGKLLQDQDE